MIKTILFATTILVSAPVIAQEAPKTSTTTADPQTAPASTDPKAGDDASSVSGDAKTVAEAAPAASPQPATQAAQPTPSQPMPAQPADVASTPTQPAQNPPQATAEQPAATQGQVADAVGREFGTYDKDANGQLSAAEFGSWMSTLRKASEPSFTPGTPEAKAWEKQAFTQADADKSASVNPAELTSFLTPKAS